MRAALTNAAGRLAVVEIQTVDPVSWISAYAAANSLTVIGEVGPEVTPDTHEWDGEAIVERALTPAPPPDEVSARQLRLALAAVGYITETEAEAWAARNALPAVVLAVIAALPQEAQFAARLTAVDMTTVQRLDPLITAALGVVDPPATEAERDDLFRLAATL